MAIFIVNENGDWWEHREDHVFHVLDTDLLTKEQKADIIVDWLGEFHEDEDIEEQLADAFQHNKVDRIIWDFGRQVKFDAKKGN